MEDQNPVRHHTLPQHLTIAELQEFIRRNSVEKFRDFRKRYFVPEEIQEFEHESSKNGREMNRLNGILEGCKEAISKGTDKELIITIPETVGTKTLDKFRKQNDDLIEKGFEEIEVEIFGIVNPKNETMEYFTLDGAIIEERTRPLSAKEKNDHIPRAPYLLNNGRTGTEG